MVFEGRLWHGTGGNPGNVRRRGLPSTCCGPRFRPQKNYTAGTRPEVIERASPELPELLGFRIWGGYGRTDSPPLDFVDRHAAPVGELRAGRLIP